MVPKSITKAQFEDAVLVFAHYLNIDLESEPELLNIARKALIDLPDGWELGIGEDEENKGIPYFFNTITNDSVWEHPYENRINKLVREERRKLENNSKIKSAGLTGALRQQMTEPTDVKKRSVDTNPKIEASKKFEEIEVEDFEDVSRKSSLTKQQQHTTTSRPGSAVDRALANGAKTSEFKELSKAGTIDSIKSAGSAVNAVSVSVAASSPRVEEKFFPREDDRNRNFSRDGRDTHRDRDISRDKDSDRVRKLENQLQDITRDLKESQTECKLLVDENKSLKSRIIELQQVIDDLEGDKKYKSDSDRMDKLKISTLEKDLSEIRSSHIKALRNQSEEFENRLRESVKRAKEDAEDSNQFKFDSVIRSHKEEISNVKSDLADARRLLKDKEMEYNALLKQMAAKKENDLVESSSDIHDLRIQTIELKETVKVQDLELKRMRDEHIQISMKLASALQNSQVATVALDAAKSDTKSAVMESQSSYHALTQAVGKLQDVDTENIRLKGEILQLNEENQALREQIKKQQQSNVKMDDKLTMSESELNRYKMSTQAEITRLRSRTLELESYLEVQRKQLDALTLQDISQNRDLQSKIDKLECELSRCRDVILENEERSNSTSSRIIALEKELIISQDSVFKKDLLLREERKRMDASLQVAFDSKKRSEEENQKLLSDIHDLKLHQNKIISEHKDELTTLERDIAERVPRLTNIAVTKVENELRSWYENEVRTSKELFSNELNKIQSEMENRISVVMEKEARLRLTNGELKLENEQLRHQVRSYRQQIDSLEGEVESKSSALRKYRVSDSIESISPKKLNTKNWTDNFENSDFIGTNGSNWKNRSDNVPFVTPMTVIDPQLPKPTGASSKTYEDVAALDEIQSQLALMKRKLHMSLLEPVSTHVLPTTQDRQRAHSAVSDGIGVDENDSLHNLSMLNSDINHSVMPSTGDRISHHHNSSNIAFGRPPINRSVNPPPPSHASPPKTFPKFPNLEDSTSFQSASNVPESPDTLFQSPKMNKPAHSNAPNWSSGRSTLYERDSGLFTPSNYSSAHTQHSRIASRSQSRTALPVPNTGLDISITSVPTKYIADSDIQSIYDGGYHEGYWKAKYLSR